MYNEAQMVEQLLATVTAQMTTLGRSFELVCVDDGSTDGTAALLDKAADADPRIVQVNFSRNFGKEAALDAGLRFARGRAVLLLDADLQHPPELIPEMVARWDAGADVVEAVKEDRGREPLLHKLASRLFYSIMGRAGSRLQGSSDFKLLDRQAVDALNACPERNRFFRGLVAWVGFRVVQLPFTVQERAAGSTKWGVGKLISYAVINLVSFTSTPLRLVAWAGFGTLLLAVLLALQTYWNWWRGVAVTGFTTVILVVLGLGGIILISVGVLAIYIAQLYDEQKGRPLYIVREPRVPRSPP
jgi:dolichol-phosphate mannosyltransferase